MRGIPYYNFPAFDAAKKKLEALGFVVVSPADMDRAHGFDPYALPKEWDWNTVPPSFDLNAAARRDVDAIFACEYGCELPGSEHSTGVAAERALTRWLGKQDIDLETGLPLPAAHVSHGVDPCYIGTAGEVRVTDPNTGGQKGSKEAQFSLIPSEALWEVAKLYGRGAKKYARNNWRKGYKWSLSMDALERHLHLFKQGESLDSETQCHHLASVVFHAFALMVFEKEHPELNDLNA